MGFLYHYVMSAPRVLRQIASKLKNAEMTLIIIIIIMYIYHALINALSAHMIHINLNRIFYTIHM